MGAQRWSTSVAVALSSQCSCRDSRACTLKRGASTERLTTIDFFLRRRRGSSVQSVKFPTVGEDTPLQASHCAVCVKLVWHLFFVGYVRMTQRSASYGQTHSWKRLRAQAPRNCKT